MNEAGYNSFSGSILNLFNGSIARLEIEGSLVRASPETLYCVLEQDTLSSAQYWFIPGNVPT